MNLMCVKVLLLFLLRIVTKESAVKEDTCKGDRLMNIIEKGSIENKVTEDTLQYQEVKDQLPCHLWSMLSMYFL